MTTGWTPLTTEQALVFLERSMDRFAGTLSAGDPAVAVPTCPGWDLRTLGHHLGNVHRWARGAIVEGHPDTAEVDAPADPQALVAWYRECADGLLDTLRTVDVDQPCWAFGPKPRTARFWFRRQAHETAMHAVDAALAQGGPAPGLDPVLALDGIDEVAGMLFPRQVRLRRTAALTRSLAVVPPGAIPAEGDGGESGQPGPRWVLAGDGTGPASSPDATADVEVRGPADLLLHLLWRRLPADDPRLRVVGDRSALDAVLGVAITP
jgi:uncharacterized protein (TIGR03083 family)